MQEGRWAMLHNAPGRAGRAIIGRPYTGTGLYLGRARNRLLASYRAVLQCRQCRESQQGMSGSGLYNKSGLSGISTHPPRAHQVGLALGNPWSKMLRVKSPELRNLRVEKTLRIAISDGKIPLQTYKRGTVRARLLFDIAKYHHKMLQGLGFWAKLISNRLT